MGLSLFCAVNRILGLMNRPESASAPDAEMAYKAYGLPDDTARAELES
ncbi:MAG: hypothetical protein JWR60_3701 [Polaromonas sp.]|nr:hypothetical protein [Polaromonas sp.]